MRQDWLVEGNPQETLTRLLEDCDKAYLLSISRDKRQDALISEADFIVPDPAEYEALVAYIKDNPDRIETLLSM